MMVLIGTIETHKDDAVSCKSSIHLEGDSNHTFYEHRDTQIRSTSSPFDDHRRGYINHAELFSNGRALAPYHLALQYGLHWTEFQFEDHFLYQYLRQLPPKFGFGLNDHSRRESGRRGIVHVRSIKSHEVRSGPKRHSGPGHRQTESPQSINRYTIKNINRT